MEIDSLYSELHRRHAEENLRLNRNYYKAGTSKMSDVKRHSSNLQFDSKWIVFELILCQFATKQTPQFNRM